MDVKASEINGVIQDASHRIYNEMLKSTEHIDEFTRDRTNISEMSSDDLMTQKRPSKPPRPPPPLRVYHNTDEGLITRRKNAICNLDLSEGEAAASKLQDLRLAKSSSKHTTNNLNGQLPSVYMRKSSTTPSSLQTLAASGQNIRDAISHSSIGRSIVRS